MSISNAVLFDGDDKSYLHWIATHLDGYVINTPRGRNPGYMILHRSVCWTISEYSGKSRIGGFTEREYIKICADDIQSLREWVKLNGRKDGSFSQKCQHCDPSGSTSDYDDG